MPIFEYTCTRCGLEFEILVRKGSAMPACVQCGASELEKGISLMSVSTPHTQKRAIAAAEARTAKLRHERAYEDHKIAHKHHHE